MRTYGRITDPLTKVKTWVVITTDKNGDNDLVYLTTLIQTLKLNLNESPFYSNYGIPAEASVLQQIFPDYYVAMTQSQYAQFFASLIITKVPSPTPVYRVNVVTKRGVKLELSVPT